MTDVGKQARVPKVRAPLLRKRGLLSQGLNMDPKEVMPDLIRKDVQKGRNSQR